MFSDSNIVKLNIGGTVFKTSKSTLTKFDGFFKAILESDIPINKDKSGAVFIDRNPKHFGKILDFMRDGHVELPESEKEVKELRNEAQYYLLEGLVELCNLKIPIDRIKVNVGGTFFETTKTTLMKYDGKLKEMCIAHDSNISDTIFIDGNAKCFEILLFFLRRQYIPLSCSRRDFVEMILEMDIYGMEHLNECFINSYNKQQDLCSQLFSDSQ